MKGSGLLLLCSALLAGGCRTAPPAAEKYFDRLSPMGTVKLFQYAVEAKQYPAAYRCLTPEVQEELSPMLFGLFLKYGRVGELGGMRARELITEAWRHPSEERVPGEPDARWVTLIYEADADAPPIEVSVLLVLLGDEWLLDLKRVRGFDLGAEHAPRDLP
ncbi:MAG: hypothetical protein ACE5GW_01560 [Planctomycetota bacterium]